MKLETFVIIAKALCYIIIGSGTPMASSLAQWAGSGKWPDKINWVVIIFGGCVGGATQLLSFLSGSYSDYTAKRAANGVSNGNPVQPQQ